MRFGNSLEDLKWPFSFYLLLPFLPSFCWYNLPCSGPQYWLYRDDATRAESAILPLSIPRGDAQSIFGIWNPVKKSNM